MRMLYCFLGFFPTLLISCAPTEYYKVTGYHEYNVKIVDIDYLPVENVKILYKKSINGVDYNKEKIFFTEKNGLFEEKVGYSVSSTIQNYQVPPFSTKLYLEISKEGYFYNKKIYSVFTKADYEKNIILVLYKPLDAFSIEFLNNKKYIFLRDKILVLIGKLNEVNKIGGVIARSVNIEDFKGVNYLTLGFVSTVDHNSINSTKYDVGKHVFEEFIRYFIHEFVEISNEELYDGFRIEVVSVIRDFSIPSDQGREVSFQFFIPMKYAFAYKNNNITRQELVNSSIILMDGDRTDLILQ